MRRYMVQPGNESIGALCCGPSGSCSWTRRNASYGFSPSTVALFSSGMLLSSGNKTASALLLRDGAAFNWKSTHGTGHAQGPQAASTR